MAWPTGEYQYRELTGPVMAVGRDTPGRYQRLHDTSGTRNPGNGE